MNRQGKVQLKTELVERLGKANAVILAEYRGLTVAQLTELREELRKSDAEFKVSKNRLLKIAINEDDKNKESFNSLLDHLTGPMGAVYVYGDAAAVAKSVLKFGETNEAFQVKAGVMDGEAVNKAQLKAISDLPSKEVLLGQIVGSLISPHRGLVTVLSGVHRNLVQVLAAIRDKKQ